MSMAVLLQKLTVKVGVYLLIDVNAPTPGESLNRMDPKGSYTADYLKRTFAVVEAFKDYDNTLLFFSGNEIIDHPGTGKDVPPYIRVCRVQTPESC